MKNDPCSCERTATHSYTLLNSGGCTRLLGAESKSQGYAHFHELIQSPVIQDMTWKPF